MQNNFDLLIRNRLSQNILKSLLCELLAHPVDTVDHYALMDTSQVFKF